MCRKIYSCIADQPRGRIQTAGIRKTGGWSAGENALWIVTGSKTFTKLYPIHSFIKTNFKVQDLLCDFIQESAVEALVSLIWSLALSTDYSPVFELHPVIRWNANNMSAVLSLCRANPTVVLCFLVNFMPKEINRDYLLKLSNTIDNSQNKRVFVRYWSCWLPVRRSTREKWIMWLPTFRCCHRLLVLHIL